MSLCQMMTDGIKIGEEIKQGCKFTTFVTTALFALILMIGPVSTADSKENIKLSDQQVENIVRRSYQYVAMYNVINKTAMPPAKAFWSATLYDLKNGFFIPNDRKKYSY